MSSIYFLIAKLLYHISFNCLSALLIINKLIQKSIYLWFSLVLYKYVIHVIIYQLIGQQYLSRLVVWLSNLNLISVASNNVNEVDYFRSTYVTPTSDTREIKPVANRSTRYSTYVLVYFRTRSANYLVCPYIYIYSYNNIIKRKICTFVCL